MLPEIAAWHRRRWGLASQAGPATSEDLNDMDWAFGWEVYASRTECQLGLWTRLRRYLSRGSAWVEDIDVVVGDLTVTQARARLLER